MTFVGDDADLVSRLERFGDVITRTDWWRTVVEGYCAKDGDCIGDGRTGSHVRLDHSWPAEIQATDVADRLKRAAQDGDLGDLDAETLLLVYLPSGVVLTDAFVPRYCGKGPRAFHRALRLESRTVAYAVVPRCGDEGALTATASHEILEAATNPDPVRRGFAFEPSSANFGFTASGIEPVDPCGLITMNDHWTVANGFVVQRAWSNRAASRGQDPCVPSRGERPYVGLVPRQPTVRLAKEGERVTVTLDAAASGSVQSWAVSAFDLTGHHDDARYVEVSLDRSTVTSGDMVTLTITARKMPPKERCIVGVVSTVGVFSSMWPVAVVMR